AGGTRLLACSNTRFGELPSPSLSSATKSAWGVQRSNDAAFRRYPDGMDAAKQKRLKARGLVIPDSAGQDAVRVYLQYRPSVRGNSRAARREALREHFERVASRRSAVRLELDPESLSV